MHDVLPAPLRRSLSKFGHDLAVARRKRRLTVSKFGHDLAVARRKRRLTVSMMAERTGLAKSTYARLEAGDPAVAMGRTRWRFLSWGSARCRRGGRRPPR